MKLYRLDPEDYKDVGSDGDVFQCGGCGWRVSYLYVLADSEAQVRKLYLNGDAGLCGSCMSDLLSEGNYTISSEVD